MQVSRLTVFLALDTQNINLNFKDETMGRLQLLQEKELRLAGCSRDCNKRSKAVLQAMGCKLSALSLALV